MKLLISFQVFIWKMNEYNTEREVSTARLAAPSFAGIPHNGCADPGGSWSTNESIN